MNLNYCCVLIYIVYTMFDLITNVDPIGVLFQTGDWSKFGSPLKLWLLAMVIFEPIGIYFAFQGYKEFKGALLDGGGQAGGMGGMMMGGGGGPVGQAANTTGTNQNQGTNSYNGNGTSYGNAGGQSAPAQNSNPRGGGTTSAFQGTGRRLG